MTIEELERQAHIAISRGPRAERVRAALRVFDQAVESTHQLNKIVATGLLDDRMKTAVAWPVQLSRQPNDPRYHAKVVAELEERGLGNDAATGRIGKPAGRTSLGQARDWARLVHEVIFEINAAPKLPTASEDGSTPGGFMYEFRRARQEIRGRLVELSQSIAARPWFIQIRSLHSVKPSDELWRAAGCHVLLALRPELKPSKMGRKKKSTKAETKRVEANRLERTAIRNAYVDLANVKGKSRNY